MIELHSFHSSSTSFRVRIALGLKRLEYRYVPVTLRWEDGDHDRAEFKAMNPQGNVPFLIDGDVRVQQSLAIIDYLDRTYPEPRLFPEDAAGRARVWSLALHLACEVQPLNNLRVERHLAGALEMEPDALKAWRRHWIAVGFDNVERQLASGGTGTFCHGETPSAADCCLVPQVYNALRPVVDHDLGRWPTIRRIYEACLALDAVQRGLPKNQPDWSAEFAAH
jgi:maleylacetoacetate isomerase